PSEQSLCFSYWSDADPYTVKDDGIQVTSQWRLAPGVEAAIGQMSIWLGRPGPSGFLIEAERWFRAHGFAQPLEYPGWLARGVLYEASAGGHVDSGFSDVGGFDAFSRQVDYLADLGVNVLWLNAVHEHKRPPNPTDGAWNHYDPLNFDVVDPILGGPDALARLADALKSAGIHFLCETVPHGGHSIQAEALEAWWTRDREGRPRNPWGGYGMDNASPEWQDVIRGHMAMLAREFGIEGARIDVADGQGPNWGSPRTPHASYSTVGGGLEMMRAIRDGIAQGPASRPVLIPESPLRREYFSISDAYLVGYGFEFVDFIRDHTGLARAEPANMAARLHAFFEAERGAMPPGALLIRTLNNHDTVVERGRVQNRFGAGLTRALYGVCLAVPGLPMMYQEEETGNFEALRAMNWTRRLLPELGVGEAEFLPPGSFAPEVFAVMRRDAQHQTLVLANLSGRPVSGRAPLPGIPDETPVYDAVAAVMSGKGKGEPAAHVRDRGVQWTLSPYETAFLRFGTPPDASIPAARFATFAANEPDASDTLVWQAGSEGLALHCGAIEASLTLPVAAWETRGDGDGVTRLISTAGTIECRESEGGVAVLCEINAEYAHTPLTLRVSNARGWRVSGESAVLSDWFVPRHHPFPEGSDYVWRPSDVWGYLPYNLYNAMLPVGRLWQSLLEPLLAEAPAVAFLSENGQGLALRHIETSAMNVVLHDGGMAHDTTAAQPALEFFAIDTNLHLQVQHLGQRQPWLLSGLQPGEPRPLRVAFTLTPFGDAAGDFAAERAPRAARGPVLEREGPEFVDSFAAVFMPRPAALTWRNLAALPGVYRLELELRHSERGPDGRDLTEAYTIELDGTPVSLDWVKLNTTSTGNAWFGHAQTAPIELAEGPHTLSIRTSRPWCAVRNGFRLIASPTD
ncbi:MAG TPA: alpha-amylase family glycosyl hydrolase, partial [Candidatus Hydrogenedentes bacterium]|nr:alpha-amylase family glycosyl hydrolase [Candidatus Hydrogenedentota bacterium]